jgi:MFS family permease
VYQVEAFGSVVRSSGRRLTWPKVSGTVLLLGLTSFLTDISAEMVGTVLPIYLVVYLQLSPLAFGLVDGLYQGGAALIRLVGGLAADRWQRHKEVAATGYALSAASKIGLLAAGASLPLIAAMIAVDRLGKGIRTGPRDALISLSTPREQLGAAFGVHRALDTAGAMIGPLIAFALLALMPGAFDAVFMLSFCIAVVGVGVIGLFVRNREPAEPAAAEARASIGTAARLLAEPRFRALVVAAALLGLVTTSDAFLYLTLQRRLDFSPGILPLLYVATAVVYMALAVPIGRLADRIGRAPVFVGGYALLIGAYAALLLPTEAVGGLAIWAVVALLGVYYAATDGVVSALASAILPAALRASGLSILTTATNVARLFASVLFGALWTAWGVDTALLLFGAGLLVALAVAGRALPRTERGAADG